MFNSGVIFTFTLQKTSGDQDCTECLACIHTKHLITVIFKDFLCICQSQIETILHITIDKEEIWVKISQIFFCFRKSPLAKLSWNFIIYFLSNRGNGRSNIETNQDENMAPSRGLMMMMMRMRMRMMAELRQLYCVLYAAGRRLLHGIRCS